MSLYFSDTGNEIIDYYLYNTDANKYYKTDKIGFIFDKNGSYLYLNNKQINHNISKQSDDKEYNIMFRNSSQLSYKYINRNKIRDKILKYVCQFMRECKKKKVIF